MEKCYPNLKNTVQEQNNMLLKALAISPDDSILQIGCGNGDLLYQIANILSHGHVVGVDESKSNVKKALIKNLEGIASGTVIISQWHDEQMVFGKEVFDKVCSIFPQMQVTDMIDKIKIQRKYLKIGGVFNLLMPSESKTSINELWRNSLMQIFESLQFNIIKMVSLSHTNADYLLLQGKKLSPKYSFYTPF